MRKVMLVGLVVVVVMATVAAFGVSGTFTYFSGTADRALTVDTVKVAVGDTHNFPLNFANLVPGQWQSQDVNVQNGSDVAADLYIQMLSTTGGTNFCSPNEVLEAAIDDLDTSTRIFGITSPCVLFPGWTGSTIVRVGDDVGAGVWKHYRVSMRLIPTAGNAYQDKSRTDTVHLIAVHSDGPAPQPDTDGGTYIPQAAWPDDGYGAYGDDQDPNYP